MPDCFRGYRLSIRMKLKKTDPSARIFRMDDCGEGTIIVYWATNDGAGQHLYMVIRSIESVLKCRVISLMMPDHWMDNHRRPIGFPYRYVGLFMIFRS